MAEHGHQVNKRINSDEDDEEESIPPPPDGGWGWMVVFGSFMIHIINDGITYSLGVFYDEFLDYFNEGKGKTALILSLLVGVTLCSGPISSALVNKWGCRVVALQGTVLASICLVISYWANSVSVLCVTIGVGTGLGFGLIYLPAIVSVTTYFEKKRSLATGIAVCGSGFGTFIFAPIISKLLGEYGWRGAMLILSGIVLQCLVFGALFRPLEYENRKNKKKVSESEIPLKSSPARLDLHVSEMQMLEDQNLRRIVMESKNPNMQRPRSLGHFTDSRNVKFEDKGTTMNGKLQQNDRLYRLASSQPLLTQSDNTAYRRHQPRGPLYKPDVFYQRSLTNINATRSRMSLRSLEAEKHEKTSLVEKKTSCCDVIYSRESWDTLREMLDFSLLKDALFLLFTISNFLTSIGFNMPYVYIVSKAKTLEIDSVQASLLLSVIGIANTIGRIILGYIADKPWVNRLWIYNVCLTICGIATFMCPFAWDFYSLAVYATVFGFTIGAYVGLTSVILVDLLGLERLTNAFGLLLLFQGIASLVGPPIGGWLFDVSGSYNPAFYLAGVAIAASGIMLFSIPYVKNYLEEKTRNGVATNV